MHKLSCILPAEVDENNSDRDIQNSLHYIEIMYFQLSSFLAVCDRNIT